MSASREANPLRKFPRGERHERDIKREARREAFEPFFITTSQPAE